MTIDLQSGEYALVATLNGDFRLFTPGFDVSDEGAILSKAAIALIAICENLSDETVIDDLVLEYLSTRR